MVGEPRGALITAAAEVQEAPPNGVTPHGLRRVAVVAAVLAVISFGGAAYLALAAPPAAVYESSASLLIDQVRAVSIAQDAGLIEKLSRLRFKYAGLITTEHFASPLATTLGQPEPAVRAALFARVDPASLLLEVGARAAEPARARELAAAAAEHLVTYVREEQAAAGVAPQDTYTFAVVTAAGDGRALPGRSARLAVVAGVAGALLAVTAAGAYLWARRH